MTERSYGHGLRTRCSGPASTLGPLHGIRYVAKDMYDVASVPTPASTRLLADNVPDSDCAVVDRDKSKRRPLVTPDGTEAVTSPSKANASAARATCPARAGNDPRRRRVYVQ